MGLFFAAVNVQAKARDAGVVPDIDEYIAVRRDTSGLSLIFSPRV